MRGGFEIRDTSGLELVDVAVHCFCLLWALPLSGDVTLTRYRGCRRPQTNRLMGGGFPALAMFGGRVHIEDCEFGHNFDDLTDIGSELGFAFKQVRLDPLVRCDKAKALFFRSCQAASTAAVLP